MLSRHADELRACGVKSLYLFGSTARGSARRNSDVDVFIDASDRSTFSLFDLLDVKYLIEDVLHAKADVTTRAGLHPALRNNIVSEAIKVF